MDVEAAAEDAGGGAAEEVRSGEEEDEAMQLKAEPVARVEGGRDTRAVKALGDPRKPSADEVQEHELTHIP